MKNNISILGVGGHGKVIIESAKLSGFNIDCFYDDDIQKVDKNIDGIKVNAPIDENFNGFSIIAIGNNEIRKKISIKSVKARWVTIIHPSAIIAQDVVVGEGTVIMAGVVIQSGTKIGKHCIINTSSCIDHDCIIHDYVHIAPKCGLAGAVTVSEGAFIGIGSSIIQNKNIGKWSIVGAGSVIIEDLPDYCTAVGIPAKPIKFHDDK